MPTANSQGAAEVIPMASHLSHPPLRAKPVLTGVTALIVRVITRQTIDDARSGTTDSIVIGLMWNMKRYALADVRVLIDLTSHLLMSSTNYENGADSGLRDTISFLSFNVNKNYLYIACTSIYSKKSGCYLYSGASLEDH
jgi:hypothetical protein